MTKIHVSGWNTDKLQVFSLARKDGRNKIRQAKENIEGLTKKEIKLSLREAMRVVVDGPPTSGS